MPKTPEASSAVQKSALALLPFARCPGQRPSFLVKCLSTSRKLLSLWYGLQAHHSTIRFVHYALVSYDIAITKHVYVFDVLESWCPTLVSPLLAIPSSRARLLLPRCDQSIQSMQLGTQETRGPSLLGACHHSNVC